MKNLILNLNCDLERGAILRCKGKHPYENIVDFMLVECSKSESLQYGMMVVSGYKSGLMYVVFPKEAISQKGYDINIDWLKENWSVWGYMDCGLEEVGVFYRDPPESFIE